VYHRQPQKRIGVPSSPNKQPALPRRPCGRTLSGAPAPCDTVEKEPWAHVPGKINPQKISRRFSSYPLEQPPPAMPRPFLAPSLHQPKKALGRFPATSWLGFCCARRGYRRRTYRRRPTLPARCFYICLADRYGQRQRAHDGGDTRG
jgi:hypothetical protein